MAISKRHADVDAGAENGSASMCSLSFWILLELSCVLACSSGRSPVSCLNSVTNIPRWVEAIHHLRIALADPCMPTIPFIGDASSLLTVCSSEKSIAVLEKSFDVAELKRLPFPVLSGSVGWQF